RKTIVETDFPLGPSYQTTLESQSATVSRNGLQLKVKALSREKDSTRMTCVLEWVDDRAPLAFWRLPAPICLHFLGQNKQLIGRTDRTSLFLDRNWVNWPLDRRLYLGGDDQFRPIGSARIEEDIWFRPPGEAKYVSWDLMEGFATSFVELP